MALLARERVGSVAFAGLATILAADAAIAATRYYHTKVGQALVVANPARMGPDLQR